MNFTEEQLNGNLYDLIFSENKCNASCLADRFDLDGNVKRELRDRFWPIIELNDYSNKELLSFISLKKERFELANDYFDLDIFLSEPNLNLDYLKYECCEYYRLRPKLWDTINNTYFYEFTTAIDVNENTLLISSLNPNQLKYYFKKCLDFIESLKSNSLFKSKSKKVITKGFKAFHHTRDYKSLKQLRKDLINGNLIHPNTKQKVFDNVFSEQDFENKINWIGCRNQLNFFINQLKVDGFIQDKVIWIKSAHIFLVGNEPVTNIQLKGSNQIGDDLSDPIIKIINSLIELRDNN